MAEEVPTPAPEEHLYTIWGLEVPGRARELGKRRATSFALACKKLYGTAKGFDDKALTYMGHKLYETKEEAELVSAP